MYKDYEIKLNAILDRQKGVKRFDFKDIKTLDKLTGQLKSLVSKLDDSKIKSEIGNYDKVHEVLKKATIDLDKADDIVKFKEEKIEDIKKELQKDLKNYNTVDKKRDAAYKKRETAAIKVFKANDKYVSIYDKADDVYFKLEDAIELVEKGAKDIGLKVDVSKYNTQLQNFNKLVKDPLDKLDFDY
tara:strand:+ start:343 stop:900 length:558 start_codon:yes stop_codon:yes gene_type:complete